MYHSSNLVLYFTILRHFLCINLFFGLGFSKCIFPCFGLKALLLTKIYELFIDPNISKALKVRVDKMIWNGWNQTHVASKFSLYMVMAYVTKWLEVKCCEKKKKKFREGFHSNQFIALSLSWEFLIDQKQISSMKTVMFHI